MTLSSRTSERQRARSGTHNHRRSLRRRSSATTAQRIDSAVWVPAFAGTTQFSPRHMRGHSEPFAVLPGPAIGVTAGRLFAVRRGVARRGMNDGEIAKHADLHVTRPEIFDRD